MFDIAYTPTNNPPLTWLTSPTTWSSLTSISRKRSFGGDQLLHLW